MEDRRYVIQDEDGGRVRPVLALLAGAACAVVLLAVVAEQRLADSAPFLFLAPVVLLLRPLAKSLGPGNVLLAATVVAGAMLVEFVTRLVAPNGPYSPVPAMQPLLLGGGAAFGLALAGLLRRGFVTTEHVGERAFPEARALRVTLVPEVLERAPLRTGLAVGALSALTLRVLAPWRSLFVSFAAAGALLAPALAVPLALGAGVAWWWGAPGFPFGRVPLQLAAGAGLAAALALLPRGRGIVRKAFADGPPRRRVRFELGGLGTRIEDMTPPAERDVPRALFVVALLALPVAFAFEDLRVALGVGVLAQGVAVAAFVACAAAVALLGAAAARSLGAVLPIAVPALVAIAAAGLGLLAVATGFGGAARDEWLRAEFAREAGGALIAAGFAAFVATTAFAAARDAAQSPRRVVAAVVVGIALAFWTVDWQGQAAVDSARWMPRRHGSDLVQPVDPWLVLLGAALALPFARRPGGPLALAAGLVLPWWVAGLVVLGAVARVVADRRGHGARAEAVAAGVLAGESAAALLLVVLVFLWRLLT